MVNVFPKLYTNKRKIRNANAVAKFLIQGYKSSSRPFPHDLPEILINYILAPHHDGHTVEFGEQPLLQHAHREHREQFVGALRHAPGGW